MRTFTVEDARRRFGDRLDEIKLKAPFGEEDDGSFLIEQDGKPVGLVPAREGLLQVMAQQEEWLRTAIAGAGADPRPAIVLETADGCRRFADGICRRGRERLKAEAHRREADMVLDRS